MHHRHCRVVPCSYDPLVLVQLYPSNAGSIRLGAAVLASAVAQWLVSLLALEQCWRTRGSGMAARTRHDNTAQFRHMLHVATPALLTTFIMHGASWMDLMAASYIPGMLNYVFGTLLPEHGTLSRDLDSTVLPETPEPENVGSSGIIPGEQAGKGQRGCMQGPHQASHTPTRWAWHHLGYYLQRS